MKTRPTSQKTASIAGRMAAAALTLFLGAQDAGAKTLLDFLTGNADNAGESTGQKKRMDPERAARLAALKRKGTKWNAEQPALKTLMEKKGIPFGAPIFLRAFKTDGKADLGTVEVWAQHPNGRLMRIESMEVCNRSGGLGPKKKEGDFMVPEGFYLITSEHTGTHHTAAFDINYPNAVDRKLGRTGGLVEVHGGCTSIGCLAMGDIPVKGLRDVMVAALASGQRGIPIHIFPFRMTPANMAAYADHDAADTWQILKPFYDSFERSAAIPNVMACGREYALAGSRKTAGCTDLNGKPLRGDEAPVLVASTKKDAKKIAAVTLAPQEDAVPAVLPKAKPVVPVKKPAEPAVPEIKFTIVPVKTTAVDVKAVFDACNDAGTKGCLSSPTVLYRCGDVVTAKPEHLGKGPRCVRIDSRLQLLPH